MWGIMSGKWETLIPRIASPWPQDFHSFVGPQ